MAFWHFSAVLRAAGWDQLGSAAGLRRKHRSVFTFHEAQPLLEWIWLEWIWVGAATFSSSRVTRK